MEKVERVIVGDVSKKFMIGYNKSQGALARFVYMFSGKEPRKLIYALKNISLSINSGEIVGIVGNNGSGKSTLLRIIAGIYLPDEGKVSIDGKIISLINLMVGLKERLTMRDNIFLCCSLFEMSQKDINRRLNHIVEFSGLHNFLNTKIYQFSEGMKQRLSFSIAVHCNPEILLLDEVFEVGDEDFKKKSANRIKELVASGCSVILVTHDMDAVEKYCDRVIHMDKGVITADRKND